MLLFQSLNLPLHVIFLIFLILYLLSIIFLEFLYLSLIFIRNFINLPLELNHLLLQRSFQLVVFCRLLHHILSLVRVKLLKCILEVLLFCSDLLVKLLSKKIFFLNDRIVLLLKLRFIRGIFVFKLFDLIIFY